MQLLAEGGSHFEPATHTHLDAWIETFGIPFAVTIDPPGVGMRISSSVAPREAAFVVDLDTMQILLVTRSLTEAYALLDTL